MRHTELNQTVYIAGAGHSGSTLLDMLLGGHSQIVTLGEVHRLYISANKSADPHLCSCGEHVLTCTFWAGVAKSLRARLNSNDLEILKHFITTNPANLKTIGDEVLWEPAVPKRYAIDLNKIAMVIGSRKLWRVLAKLSTNVALQKVIAENSHILFDAVREASGKPVIVDATKNANRLKGLYLISNDLVRIIYLVRDGRAVTNSRIRRHNVSIADAARVWKAEHQKLKLALATIPKERILLVRYEDLCRDPSTVLTTVCRFLNLDYERQMLEFRAHNHHRLGGNPMRFRHGERRIRLDERWKRQLTSRQCAVFKRIAGSLNSEFGYQT